MYKMDYRYVIEAERYLKEGKYPEALEIYFHLLDKQMRSLGNNHLTTLVTRSNIALVYENIGKLELALNEFQLICKDYESKINPSRDSYFLLQTKSGLARVLGKLGEQSKAMEVNKYIEKTLKCRAEAFEKLSKSDNALNYFEIVERCHNCASSILGNDHESTLRMHEVIGDMRSLKGEYKDALKTYGKVFEGLTDLTPAKEKDYLRVYFKMASIEEKLGKYDDALTSYKSIRQEYKGSRKYDCIFISEIDMCIVNILRRMGYQNKAKEIFNTVIQRLKANTDYYVELCDELSSELYSEICRERCRKIVQEKFRLAKKIFYYMKSILPFSNEDTLRMGWVIASMYRLMEKYKDSLQIYEDVYEKSLSCFGPNHSLAINSCLDRVSLLRFLCDLQQAHAVLNDFSNKRKAVLEIKSEMYDNIMLKIRYECGNIFYEEGLYEKAMDIYDNIYNNCKANAELTRDVRRMHMKTLFKVGHLKRALTIIKQFYDDTPNLDSLNVGHLRKKGVIRFLADIADINEQLGEYDRAMTIYASMQRICRDKEIDFPLHIRNKIAIILAKQDKSGTGHVEIFQRLIKECEKINNPAHSLISSIRKGLAMAYINQNEVQTAFSLYNELLAENEEILGNYHSDTLKVKYLWAKCFLDLPYSLLVRKEMLETVRMLRHAVLYPFHPDCLSVNYNIAKINEKMENFDEAFQIYCDIYTKTGFYYSESNRYLPEIKKRIDSIANSIQEPGLIRATNEGNLREVESCLSNGNDVNVRGANGFTPMHIASQRGYTDILKCLLKHGASYEIKNWEWKTPADIARNNAIVNILYNVKQLFLSIKRDDLESVKSIIQYRSAVVNAKNENCFSPLLYATYRGHKDIVKYLLDNGADVKSRALKGDLALHLAAVKGDSEMILMLVEHIEDNLAEDFQEMFNDNKNARGATPLHLAALENHVETVYLLRGSPAYCEKRDKLGKLPIDLATGREVKDFLETVEK